MRQQTQLGAMRAKLQLKAQRRNFTVTEYCVPEWALSVLLNDDASGLEDRDATVAAFLRSENLGNGHWSFDSSDNEAYFCHRNDITNIADNCVDIQWIQWIE